jgi:hypothetical protein
MLTLVLSGSVVLIATICNNLSSGLAVLLVWWQRGNAGKTAN